jgi:SAM-dependent methyltransferase
VVNDLAITGPELEGVKGSTVLSVGEGFSTFAKGLEEMGARVTAVDPLYALTPDELKRHFTISGGSLGTDEGRPVPLDRALENLPASIAAGTATALPFGDDTVERVYVSHMFYWLKEDEKRPAIEEFLRVTAPGGTVVLNTAGRTDVLTIRDLAPELGAVFERRNGTSNPVLLRKPSSA